MPDTHYLGQPLNFAIPLRVKMHGERFHIIDNHEVVIVEGIGGPQDAQYIVDAVNEYQPIRQAVIAALDDLKTELDDSTPVYERVTPLYERLKRFINERIVQYGA